MAATAVANMNVDKTSAPSAEASKGEKNEKMPTPATIEEIDVTNTLHLNSKDCKSFTIVRAYAMMSALIKTGLENDQNAKEFPVPGVTGEILELIVAYLAHHKGVEPKAIEKPLRGKEMKQVVEDKWDADFIDQVGETRQTLYDLILAANYMDIRGLLHLGCAKVASLIKGQPLDKIKDILDHRIKNGKLPPGAQPLPKVDDTKTAAKKDDEAKNAPSTAEAAKTPPTTAKQDETKNAEATVKKEEPTKADSKGATVKKEEPTKADSKGSSSKEPTKTAAKTSSASSSSSSSRSNRNKKQNG